MLNLLHCYVQAFHLFLSASFFQTLYLRTDFPVYYSSFSDSRDFFLSLIARLILVVERFQHFPFNVRFLIDVEAGEGRKKKYQPSKQRYFASLP